MNKISNISAWFCLIFLSACSSPEIIDLNKAYVDTVDLVRDTFHFQSLFKPNPMVVTDKRVYKNGESIEVTITNDSDKEIIIKHDATRIFTFLGEVPVPHDTLWVAVSRYANINVISLNPGGIDEKKIEPGGSLCYNLINCKPGRYIVSYRINPEGTWGGYMINSAEIEVK